MPSIVFSVIYLILFGNNENFSLKQIYEVLEGVGHMWFLPMLFWCFILLKLFARLIRNNFGFVLFTSALLASLSFVNLPLRLNLSFYYFPFFLLGYLVWDKNVYFKKSVWLNLIIIVSSLVFFYFVFNFTNIGIETFITKEGFASIIIQNCFYSFKKLIYHIIVIYFVFQMMMLIRDAKIEIQPQYVKLSECCFGVYLIQQFILVYIYDKTQMPYVVNSYALPWISFIIALTLSLIGAYLIRLTKLGRKYI